MATISWGRLEPRKTGRPNGYMGSGNRTPGVVIERISFRRHQGAQLLDAERLITWARDYPVRAWALGTGECLTTISMPVWPDENTVAYLSSALFSQLADGERVRYVSATPSRPGGSAGLDG